MPAHESAGVDQVEIRDLAADGHPRLVPAVLQVFRPEVGDLEVADVGIVGEETVGLLVLAHQGGLERPVVVQVDLQLGAAAVGVDGVVVVLGQHLVGGAGGGIGAHAVDDSGRREGAIDVVDVAGVVLLPAH